MRDTHPRRLRALCAILSCLSAQGVACIMTGCAADGAALPKSISNASVQAEEFDTSGDVPPTARTLHAMARLLVLRSRDAEAEAVLNHLIAEHPRYAPGYCSLAALHLRLQRVADAVHVLEAGLKAVPNDSVLLNDLGMCWLVREDYVRALHHFAEAAAVAPNNARYRSNMALALGMMGRYEEALCLFEQVVSPADAHLNLALVCEARKDHARANAEYAESVSLRTTCSDE